MSSYSPEIISGIKIISLLSDNDYLQSKKEICMLINGRSEDDLNVLSRWGIADPNNTDDNEITLKPQYIHAATSIYLLIKYPQLRPESSFVTLIINSKIENECLKIALDVLNSDPDCKNFASDVESVFGSTSTVYIADQINDTIKECSK